MWGGEKTTDKGKPVERRGRKAMGLKSQCDYDRQVAEVNKERLFGIIRLAYRKSGIFYRNHSSSLAGALCIQPPNHGRLDTLTLL